MTQQPAQQPQQPWQQPAQVPAQQPAQQPWQQPQAPHAQQPAQQPWQQPHQPQFQPQQSQPVQPMHGAPQMAAAVTSPGTQPKKSKTGLIIGIVVGVLVVGGGVTAAVLLMGGGDKKSSTSASESSTYGGDAEDEKDDKVAAGSGTGTGTGTGSGGAGGAIAMAIGNGSGSASSASDSGPVPELVAVKNQACACVDADCASKAQESFTAWATKYKDYQGSKDQTDQVMKLAEELSECLVKGMTAGTAEAPPPTTTSTTSSGIPECDRYIAAIEQYASCDKIPPSARESVMGSIEQMKSGWAQMGSMPDEAKKQTADACSQGADGLVQAAQSLGCTMDIGASPTTTTTTTTTPPAPTTSTVTAPPADMPNCGRYKTITESLMKCDKMPAQAMDGLKQGLDAMSQAWTSYGSMGADVKKSLDDGCKQAADALEQVSGQLGCSGA